LIHLELKLLSVNSLLFQKLRFLGAAPVAATDLLNDCSSEKQYYNQKNVFVLQNDNLYY